MNQALILQAQGEGGAGQYVVVDQSPFRVGRHPDNDFQIAQADVSGLHAQLCFEDGCWWAVDNRSTNGTFVNGERIVGRSRLRLKDILHFASKGFEVVPVVHRADDDIPMATQVLGDSADIKGMVDLVNIVSDQRTYPVWQPIIELATKETFGWEALGRGVSADGPVSPGTLFRLAGQNRVEGKLSQRFRETAVECALCRHCWPNRSKAHLFFNLHPDEVKGVLFEQLIEALSRSDLLHWYRVVLEMHESLVCNTGEMQVLVKQSRDAGLLVAYDDFGAGQSRISDLISVPPDFLKLDRALITGLTTESAKHVLVKGIIDACRHLKVRTLAEGIETTEELGACAALGINLGQGFLLCKPKAPFALFDADSTGLPSNCPYVRLDVVSLHSNEVPVAPKK